MQKNVRNGLRRFGISMCVSMLAGTVTFSSVPFAEEVAADGPVLDNPETEVPVETEGMPETDAPAQEEAEPAEAETQKETEDTSVYLTFGDEKVKTDDCDTAKDLIENLGIKDLSDYDANWVKSDGELHSINLKETSKDDFLKMVSDDFYLILTKKDSGLLIKALGIKKDGDQYEASDVSDDTVVITYDGADGTLDSDRVSVRMKDAKISRFDVSASREGAEFTGWTLDGVSVSEDTAANDDLDLVASYRSESFEIPVHEVMDGEDVAFYYMQVSADENGFWHLSDLDYADYQQYEKLGVSLTMSEEDVVSDDFVSNETQDVYMLYRFVSSNDDSGELSLSDDYSEEEQNDYSEEEQNDIETEVPDNIMTQTQRFLAPRRVNTAGVDENGSDDAENNGSDETPQSDTYQITFDTDGGSACDDITVNKGESADLPTPARSGYTFDGWYKMDGTKVESPVTPDADLALTARWTQTAAAVTYTVTFYPQNGTKTVLAIYDEGNAIGEFPSVSRTGWTLLGWFDAASGGNKVIADELVSADRDVYAQWVKSEDPVGTYVLTLDPNGGLLNGSADAYSPEVGLVAGQTYGNDVSSYAVTREGYLFNGWEDADGNLVYNPDGSCVEGTYWNNKAYAGDDDLTVYAKWEAGVVQRTLTFDTNGGNDIEDATYGDGDLVNSFPTPVRAGYTFDGWFTEKDGGDAVTSLTMDTDKTLYAHWTKGDEKKSYTVIFDANGGDAVASVTADEGTQIQLPTSSRTGYKFLGWYTAKSGGTKVLTLTVTQDVTLYAQWEDAGSSVVDYVSVTFDTQDGNTSVQKFKKGTSISSFKTPSRSGYTFNGWFTQPEGGDQMTSYDGSSDITLYAQWTKDENPDVKKTFTITYDPQGGTAVTAQSVEEGSCVESFPQTTRDGYTFLGWYTKPDGGGRVTAVNMKSDVTLYAHWAENEKTMYSVKLNDNYVGGSTVLVSMEEGSVYSTFPERKRDGYTFLGWFTDREGGSKVTSYTVTGNATFYAHWQEDKAETEESKVEWIKLNVHSQTVYIGDKLNVNFDWGPKDAKNAKFVWTSSNPDVIKAVKTTNNDGTSSYSFKYKGFGETTLTVSTADGSVSDSMTVTVSGQTGANPGQTNGENGTNGQTLDNEDSAVKRLNLTVVSSTGRAQSVQVNDNVALSDLASKLGINAASYTYKTYTDSTVKSLDAAMKMSDVVALAKDGDLLIVGYDYAGQLVGSAKVTRTGELAYNVTMSRDANQTLSAAVYKDGDDAGIEGSTEKSNEVSNAGKSDEVAQETKTGDMNIFRILGICGAALAGLLGGLFALLKRRKA